MVGTKGGIMPKANRSGAVLGLAPRHKVWLTLDGSFLMGPNYLRFLRAVDETGTIREAGKVVGWSYRTCLNHVRRMEGILGTRVLETARGGRTGGGARLSPETQRLIGIFSRWQEDVATYSRRAFRKAVNG
jgi:molybdate transport system regulatory protein